MSFATILIGYSTFFILVIRSNANTPIDENNPEDAVSLLAYLNREQYGDWPILNGQYYNANVVDLEDGTPVYTKDEESGKYVITNDRKNSNLFTTQNLVAFFQECGALNNPHMQKPTNNGVVKKTLSDHQLFQKI